VDTPVGWQGANVTPHLVKKISTELHFRQMLLNGAQ
jgi:hypothetical protein